MPNPMTRKRPVVCFDETSTQLLAETRPSLRPAEPGLPQRQDYAYRREGTRNLFLTGEPLAGWRQVAVTERRTRQDFAQQMRWLVDEAYPEVPVVRVVLGQPRIKYGAGSEHPSPGFAVRDVPGSRGPAHRQTAGVPLHPQARELVEPGRNRVHRTGPLLFAATVQSLLGASVEVVKRNELHTFVVLPKRWVVERSFGRLEKCRRLWKNCERKLNTSLQMVVLAFAGANPEEIVNRL